ncbi:restriction endonuclease subunit S [Alkalimonas sp. MEB108]|uniref:Restriction endonuclease subunit S n=1 Tax=Alkalimonas cellulosilytica TaxID=3058395 RepID=A0ABU7J0L2_9GAMM|nr:restriction endonuclease subunit S [Alkalimonas sp. MEB108]MEE2000028.1 restriction endonuclease subunit S [Alkalimonas sp. MEB108]
MSSEWKTLTLSEIALNGKEGLVDGPFGSALPADSYKPSGVPVIRGSNLSRGEVRFKGDEFVFVSEELAQKLTRATCIPDDIVFTKKGTLGQVGIVPHVPHTKYLLSSNQMRLRVNRDLVRPDFAYYYLSQKSSIDKILRDSEHTGVPKINLAYLRSFRITVPPLAAQDLILSVLKNLDLRIALLRETNATLESIAQALFKSWFVDFDPVHANAGTQAPSLPPEIQALFPSRLEESPQELIPEGWEWVSLKEATQIFDSKRVPLSGQDRAKRKGPYPYYGAASLMDWVDDYIFDGVYLLMGEDGSVADKNGFPITQYVWGKIWVNNHAHVLQGKNGISTEHLMLAIKGVNIQPYMTGAVQAKLSQSNMWRIQFLMPTKPVAESFAKLIEPLFIKIRANSEQAVTLANLRDTILPRLISGQLRLPDAEAAVAEMV